MYRYATSSQKRGSCSGKAEIERERERKSIYTGEYGLQERESVVAEAERSADHPELALRTYSPAPPPPSFSTSFSICFTFVTYVYKCTCVCVSLAICIYDCISFLPPECMFDVYMYIYIKLYLLVDALSFSYEQQGKKERKSE